MHRLIFRIIFITLFVALFSLSLTYSLEYSTYIGGTGIDVAYDVTYDQDGNIIVAGWTWGPEFPTTGGAYDTTHNGDEDVFVMKLTSDLSTLLASTLVGGSGEDKCSGGVGIDPSGNIIITGRTDSTDLPATPGAFDTSYNGGWQLDLFVLTLSPSLNSLQACTYLGGYGYDNVIGFTIDDSDNVVVTGDSRSEDYPITPGAYDTTCGVASLIISKLSPDLSTLIASTFIGGDQYRSSGYSVVQDQFGNYTVAGYTYDEGFPTTAGAYDRILDGSPDCVVFTISSDLRSLLYSTYVGGSEYNKAQDIDLDSNGNVVVCGWTTSSDFPTTSGAYDETYNDDGGYLEEDIIVIKLSPDLSTLLASTFVGSNTGASFGRALAVDSSDSIIVTGYSFDPGFPTTPGAYDTSFNGLEDVILFVMPPDLSALHYSTFVGGAGYDIAYDLVLDGPGSVVVAGEADAGFPVTEGAYDTTHDGVLGDGFVMKLHLFRDGYPGIVTGPGPGETNPPLVRASDAEWQAYGVAKHGVNVACGDLDGDGYDEILTGPGPGAEFGPHVRGWKSDGTALPNVNFLAYGTNKFGVNVSAGDLDGDGMDEILTGAGPGAVFGPHVRGWNVDGGTVTPIGDISYFAYGTNKYGVNVSAGDIDGDGFDEIITGAGPGTVFGPHVRGWDYDGSGPIASISAVSYLAYGTNQWGVNVACGDLDGDGIDEIITGPGPGIIFGSHVRGWKYDGSAVIPLAAVSYFAYLEAAYGVVVSAFDVDHDGMDEILTMPGPDPAQPAHAKAWNVDGGAVTAIESIDFIPYYSGMTHGGRIAGGRFSP